MPGRRHVVRRQLEQPASTAPKLIAAGHQSAAAATEPVTTTAKLATAVAAAAVDPGDPFAKPIGAIVPSTAQQ